MASSNIGVAQDSLAVTQAAINNSGLGAATISALLALLSTLPSNKTYYTFTYGGDGQTFLSLDIAAA